LALTDKIESKILPLDELLQRIKFWRALSEKIIFTNGCFDILHEGHIHLLSECRGMGGMVIIGLNSDASVKRLKGKERPINKQHSRAVLLSAIEFVDAVTIFNESTPEKLIHSIKPDILVKGGDWKKKDIVGADFVETYGGAVKTIPYLKGFSTTGILAKSKNGK
jgi:rfaE bifunctional protein nucleotidyltransferase chain/domain